ncbi:MULTISPECIES: DMT family transporter [unclassified Campylobacter]|uniref:DMT family transporter n=1 Tax=unclassified Campylobacter TaxID=2593542 RepID=UPI0022E9B73E|nr:MULTISPECIES: EamA family transporter [unclassified Campylobacter]MDA3043808.1 DMT family transporter [Campylobacter sp. JMF_09 ED2]MDA3045507.1 DMT family transporter [Campylobacter sp. JMF_07 ED4]MDA3064648.1 DMT family transporter [Campylobacter sp. JMF_11 EL3]MDA3072523.1 DMT family transporter [Campylobacter sp. VBCF_03 NA9]MDA3075666.1 DMT family transporter [Campylobacter sp. JMF_05 ED3]
MKTQSIIFGIFITFLGGVLWGFSGVCGQYLFEIKGVSANWLVPLRLLCAGGVLVIYCAFSLRDRRVFAPILDANLRAQFLAFSILGLMLTQYFYFYFIELSNAAVATVIQYTAPAMILAIVCITEARLPKINEFVSLILAILGVVILATHGDLGSLVISQKALIFCLLSAACVCVYNLAPKKLNQKYPVVLNLGWGMVLGGVVLGGVLGVWNLAGVSDLSGVLAFLGVVFFGTVLAFSFYMVGVKLIGAPKASLIAAIEPVSAAFFAHFWLGTKFVFLDFVGFVLILSCILLLAKKG